MHWQGAARADSFSWLEKGTAGEGDGDAAVFVLGMIVGAAFSHNFGLASSPAGLGPYGVQAIFLGLGVCLAIGFFMRKKMA